MTTSATFTVGTQNVQDLPRAAISPEQATADLVRSLRGCDLIGLQEIGSEENRASLREATRIVGKRRVWRGRGEMARRNGSPVAWDNDAFEAVDSGVTLLHEGEAKICVAKFITWVHVRHRESGLEALLVSVHFVSGSFKNPPKAHPITRLRLWNEGQRNLVAFLEKRDLAAAVVGDFNRRATLGSVLGKKINGRRVRRAPLGPLAIDHIYLVDGKRARWTVEKTGTEERHSDHRFRWARVRLTGNPKPPQQPDSEEEPMSQAQKIISIAKAEVGYLEGRSSNGSWNNQQKYSPQVPGLEWSQNQPWCATFVAWCAMKAGLASLYPRTASCDVGMAWFRDQGRWSEYPAVGAQVFFGSYADSVHTGLVIGYDADTITTIEGNTNDSGSREGNGVYLKRRQRRDPYVVGYGYPAFAEGIRSADPKWKDKQPGKPEQPSKDKKQNRVDRARALLVEALENSSKRPQRAAKIKAALDALPGK